MYTEQEFLCFFQGHPAKNFTIGVRTLMSNFLDIDLVIKFNATKPRRFDLSKVIFKWE